MRRSIAIGVAAAATVAGAGGAVAATKDAPRAEQDAVVGDVAKELGVAPERLARLGLGHRAGMHAHGRGAVLEAAAAYLGATRAELREARRSGRSLASLAEERGKPVSGLEAALVAAHDERLDAAVAAGRLTQTQADRRAAGFAERVGELVRAEGRPGRHGHRRP